MTVELADYGRILRARWVSVAAVIVGCLSLAALITWQTTPAYSSTATLFIATQDSDAAQLYQGGLFAQQRAQSYADVVGKSQELARTVAADLDGRMPPATVMSEITATVVPDTVNLVLTATDANPRQAQAIAQGYAKAVSTLVGNLETSDSSQSALIHAEIVQDATIDTTPVSPRPERNLAFGLLVGLVLGISAAIARDLLDNSVSSPEDVSGVTDAPVLGQITADSRSTTAPPQRALAAPSDWAEGFRVLRTNMRYVDADAAQKVLVVTSSLPQEGKSTTAVTLAVTLAQTDVRVALVECDLRRPLIAERIGLDDAVGTTTVLIGGVALGEAMQSYGGVDVLTCGPIPPNPSELLQSPAMARLLAELRAAYDVVLLDAPPLLPVTDAALLAAQTDGAVIVVRHGKTTRDQLAIAVDRLASVEARALGVVLNMVPARHPGGASSYSRGHRAGENSLPRTQRDQSAPDQTPAAQTPARTGVETARSPVVDRPVETTRKSGAANKTAAQTRAATATTHEPTTRTPSTKTPTTRNPSTRTPATTATKPRAAARDRRTRGDEMHSA